MFVEVAEKDTLIAIVLEAGFHSESSQEAKGVSVVMVGVRQLGT